MSLFGGLGIGSFNQQQQLASRHAARGIDHLVNMAREERAYAEQRASEERQREFQEQQAAEARKSQLTNTLIGVGAGAVAGGVVGGLGSSGASAASQAGQTATQETAKAATQEATKQVATTATQNAAASSMAPIVRDAAISTGISAGTSAALSPMQRAAVGGAADFVSSGGSPMQAAVGAMRGYYAPQQSPKMGVGSGQPQLPSAGPGYPVLPSRVAQSELARPLSADNVEFRQPQAAGPRRESEYSNSTYGGMHASSPPLTNDVLAPQQQTPGQLSTGEGVLYGALLGALSPFSPVAAQGLAGLPQFNPNVRQQMSDRQSRLALARRQADYNDANLAEKRRGNDSLIQLRGLQGQKAQSDIQYNEGPRAKESMARQTELQTRSARNLAQGEKYNRDGQQNQPGAEAQRAAESLSNIKDAMTRNPDYVGDNGKLTDRGKQYMKGVVSRILTKKLYDEDRNLYGRIWEDLVNRGYSDGELKKLGFDPSTGSLGVIPTY